MNFIDLFAGIGGFHLALSELGHECVFASEIDPILQVKYEQNFNMKPFGDITKIAPKDIPKHDILCAGFPCQPFSKAGVQKGIDDKRGTLLFQIINILKTCKPKFFILENVANFIKNPLYTHLYDELKDLYKIQTIIMSPHSFGIPQNRPRIYIVGSTSKQINFSKVDTFCDDIYSFFTKKVNSSISKVEVEHKKVEVIEMWDKILTELPMDKPILSPLWSMEFLADYPFEETTPHKMSAKELQQFKGAFGVSLMGLTKQEQIMLLPNYARIPQDKFPSWKINFIRSSRKFCIDNSNIFNQYKEQLMSYPPSYQKLEWNCGALPRNIWNYIIQLRPSGIRVKKNDTMPSLVALNLTQVPIIGRERRYLSVEEGLALQSFPCDHNLPDVRGHAFKALGNAVNVDVVKFLVKHFTD